MGRLVIRLLGLPDVRVDDRPLEVDTRKAVALLAYLAVTGQAHSRDSLAALLWPESDGASARAALRRTLSTLRSGLAGRWLTVERDAVGLDFRDIDLDVARLAYLINDSRTHEHATRAVCLRCLEALAEAERLSVGEFMSGFSLRDSVEFDDWQAETASALRDELSYALDKLIEGYGALGRFDEAIASAKRRLSLDPLQEASHQALMRLHAWRGDRSAAIRQYRECVRVLNRELGVSVLEETASLNRQILEGTLEPPAREVPAHRVEGKGDVRTSIPVASDAFMLPMVGRGKQWATLMEVLGAQNGSGRFVAIEGEAGIGKSRLLSEFLAQAQSEGRYAISQRCFEGETGLAYAPIVHAIRAAIELDGVRESIRELPGEEVAEVARLVPELAAIRTDSVQPGTLAGPGAEIRFYRGLAQVIYACLGEGGVLAIDDVQWADDASLDFLGFLARRLDAWPLLLLVTWRSESVGTDHRWRAVLADCQREGTAVHIELGRLSADEVFELVSSEMGESHPGLPARMLRETEGLPLFLVEYLRALRVPDSDGAMPANVQQLLRRRLAGLGEPSLQLLSAAAVLGRSFSFDLVRSVSGRSEDEALDALDELLSRRLVVEVEGAVGERDAHFDFYHDRLRELIYADTSLARRRLLHRRSAEALKRAAGSRGPDGAAAAAIAHHFRLAGDDIEAAGFFQRAGEHAGLLHANSEALSHFETALALGHPDVGTLHESIGDLQTLAGRYGEGLRSYEMAAAVAKPEAQARIEHKLGALYQRLGEWEMAESRLEAGLALDTGEPGLRARLFADLSLTALRQQRIDHAQDLADQAMTLARTADDNVARAQAYNVLGIIARMRGNLEEAEASLGASLAIAEERGDLHAKVAALNNLSLVLADREDYAAAQTRAEAALQICITTGDRHREAAIRNTMADLHHRTGRKEDAMQELGRAVAIFAEVGGTSDDAQPEIWKLREW